MVHRIQETIDKLTLAAATRAQAGRIRHCMLTAPVEKWPREIPYPIVASAEYNCSWLAPLRF